MNKEAKGKIKDTVFTDLFRDVKNQRDLYLSLHPGDCITEEEINTVTIQPTMVDGIYNDLGFIAKDKLIVMVEAQSTWNLNMPLRQLMYYVETVRNEYIGTDLSKLYRTSPISIPRPELYVAYTGDRVDKPEVIRFSDVYFDGERSDIDVTVHMIYGDDGNNIIDQYIKFAKKSDRLFKEYGRSNETVIRLIEECKRENILLDYLSKKEKEVVTIMTTLFDQEKLTESYGRDRYNSGVMDGMQTGLQSGEARTLIRSVNSLVNKKHYTVEEACNSLDWSIDDYKKAKELIAEMKESGQIG